MAKKRRPRRQQTTPGVTRRGFIGTVGAGALAAAAGPGAAVAEEKTTPAGTASEITLHVNGRPYRVAVEPRFTLLYVIRDLLGLVATKPGCERGECGACTVLVDGRTQYACMTLAVDAAGREITTAEGLMHGEELGLVQQAFVEEDAYQCGFCTPGQVVAMEGMLRRNPSPGDAEIRTGMSGNLCRCGAYEHIFRAARNAAAKIKDGGAS